MLVISGIHRVLPIQNAHQYTDENMLRLRLFFGGINVAEGKNMNLEHHACIQLQGKTTLSWWQQWASTHGKQYKRALTNAEMVVDL